MKRLLVANRGEIARRVMRTARAMGIETVAVYSEADAGAPFVRDADHSVCIGPASPAESYANIDAVIAAVRSSGADAVHPGYGFLAESAPFAEAVANAGAVFVGPSPAAMRAMSDKVDAKQTMAKAGVPVVPGPLEPLADVDAAAAAAEAIGYPVMLKAAAGGGGIGMYLCKKEKKLRQSFEDAQKKGEMYFGSSVVFLEKAVERPRHVEVQVMADTQGNTVHLFERECSVQRRHQKVLEEAPSADLRPEVRAAMCDAAVKAAEAVDYVGAGTVEFIVDAEQNFYFIEMNTRLQVEHPITEMTTGVDLVEWQLRVARGETLGLSQDTLAQTGHAIEVRLCAEDPDRRFFPSPGTLETVAFPEGPGIRVESAVESGSEIAPTYDSMFAKLIAYGDTRDEAIERLLAALNATTLEGVATNLSLHVRTLENPVFRAGSYATDFIKAELGLKS